MKTNDSVREIAVVANAFDISTEYYDKLMISGNFNYEGGGSQGLCWIIDDVFITKLLRALGVNSLQKTKGRYVYVTHSDNRIEKIEPIFRKYGETFDILEWSDLLKDDSGKRMVCSSCMKPVVSSAEKNIPDNDR